MVSLDDRFFRGESDLSADTVNKLATVDTEKGVTEVLTRWGWEGQLIAGVVLAVSTDGSTAQDGRFFVKGKLTEEPVTLQAGKLWPKADAEVMVTMMLPKGDNFKFEEGRVFSEYLELDRSQFVYRKAGQTIEPGDWKKAHVGDLTLRLFTQLDKSANGKEGPTLRYTLLSFSQSKEELVDCQQASNPRWPGIKIAEGRLNLFPKAREGTWGAPIFPILDLAMRADNSSQVPGGQELRYALSTIMRTACTPIACNSHAGVKKMQKALLENNREGDHREPSIVWPAAARPEPATGKCASHINLHGLKG